MKSFDSIFASLKNEELYTALHNEDINAVVAEIDNLCEKVKEQNDPEITNEILASISYFVRSFQNRLETDQERIIFEMGKLSGQITPHRYKFLEELKQTVISDLDIDENTYNCLLHVFIKYGTPSIENFQKETGLSQNKIKTFLQLLENKKIAEPIIFGSTYYKISNYDICKEEDLEK